ncbi:MAG: glycosyltransferase family protein, partial [Thermotogota bacterium]|nr:glycosyltransferase family protein [Thermotogota bacterium]
LSKLIDEVVIALPDGGENDIIVATVKKYNDEIIITRGSEDNVLERYYHAAVQANAEVVVRITSDCPLIDPVVADSVIDFFLNNDFDYCSNTLVQTYPRGLDTEVFSFSALERAYNEAKEEYEKEHVTPYIIENPDKFRLFNVPNNTDLSHFRWTLDTQEDFDFLEAVYKKIYPKKQYFLMNDVLDLLNKEPDLIEINKNVEQKKIH